jgi:hypothetical protein
MFIKAVLFFNDYQHRNSEETAELACGRATPATGRGGP